jgi:hypothetical protein
MVRQKTPLAFELTVRLVKDQLWSYVVIYRKGLGEIRPEYKLLALGLTLCWSFFFQNRSIIRMEVEKNNKTEFSCTG